MDLRRVWQSSAKVIEAIRARRLLGASDRELSIFALGFAYGVATSIVARRQPAADADRIAEDVLALIAADEMPISRLDRGHRLRHPGMSEESHAEAGRMRPPFDRGEVVVTQARSPFHGCVLCGDPIREHQTMVRKVAPSGMGEATSWSAHVRCARMESR